MLVRNDVADRAGTRARADAIVHRRALSHPELIDDVRALTVDEARDAALRLLDDKTMVRTFRTAKTGDILDRVFRENDEVARRALVTETPVYRSAFMKMVLHPERSPMTQLDAQEREALGKAHDYLRSTRAQSEGSQGAGAFAVPISVDGSLIFGDGYGAVNPFWDLCRVEDVTTDRWRGVISPGVPWGWKSEAAASVDVSLSQVSQPTVPVRTAVGSIEYSAELGDDWEHFGTEMARALATEYSTLTLTAFVNGNGTTAPTGVLVALAAVSATQLVTSATDGAFSDTDLVDTWSALGARYRANATWLLNPTVMAQVRLHSSLFHASAVALNGAVTASEILMGRQCIELDAMPVWSSTTGASTRLVCIDLQQFLIARRIGMTVEAIPWVLDVATNRPKNRVLAAYARVGSDLINPAGGVYQANV